MCEPEDLARFRGRGFVVAPAGFGKTHLIAQATALAEGRQLILTHTYAGVNALKRKMQLVGADAKNYRIDTIASWVLRICLAYGHTSGWANPRPDGAGWNQVYASCERLLDREFIRKVVRASYTGLYVDEYQDCSVVQHGLVLKLARDLPCRVFGDPLQGIFDFDGQAPVDWVRDVEGSFAPLGRLTVPHRWERAGAPELGAWLTRVRERLERGEAVDLNVDRPASVRVIRNIAAAHLLQIEQANTCRRHRAAVGQTVIAIHKGSNDYKYRCHSLAKKLSGMYASIEEVEGRDVFSFLNKIEGAARAKTRLKRAIEFAESCMNGVGAAVPSTAKEGEVTTIRANTRNPAIAKAANAYLNDGQSATLATLLKEIRRAPGTKLTRADLFNRVLGVLRTHELHPELPLREAGDQYQREFRHRGRPVGHHKIIGTTLLVKGLEYDHAIVLEATSLTTKDLYVALTRGARTVTIITGAMILNPAANA